MKITYKLIKDKLIEYHDGEQEEEYNLENFVSAQRKLIDILVGNINYKIEPILHDSEVYEEIEEIVKNEVIKRFSKLFKKEISDSDLRTFEHDIENKFKKDGIILYDEVVNFIKNKIRALTKKELNKEKIQSKIGGLMFKTLKEAKLFTSHLDALASEIENLQEIDSEIKTHLAYRLDSLSEMIETESNNTEKMASMKEANGIGSGSWAYDPDESSYMSSFGGTGALQQDADEPYMAEFKGDDHKEVLTREEPNKIRDDGARQKQWSEGYNEQAVANKLRGQIKSIMAKLSEKEEEKEEEEE